MKTFKFTKLIALTLVTVMLLGAIPAMGISAESDVSAQSSVASVGIQNLLDGNTATIDPSLQGELSDQEFIWSQSGLHLSAQTSNSASLFMVNDAGQIELTNVPVFVNRRFAHGSNASDYIGKAKSNAAILELLYGETGPSKYSLYMDFTINSKYTGTAEANNYKTNPVTKHRGFSLIDIGGGWIIKATAPGTGALTLETDENGDPLITKVTTSGSTVVDYYTVDSVAESDPTKGYLYASNTSSTCYYMFDAESKMGISNDQTYLNTLADNEKIQIGTTSSYYTKGSCSGGIHYNLIDGNADNQEAFAYTANQAFTLRFDFTKTKVSGANNDSVNVKVYAVSGNDSYYIGDKTFDTTASILSYGIRLSDNRDAQVKIDNVKLTIDESSYVCGGDHDSYWSACQPHVENLRDSLVIRYDCGAVDYVDNALKTNIKDVLSGNELVFNHNAINNTGIFEYIVNLKTSGSYVAPSATSHLLLIGGKNVLSLGSNGNLILGETVATTQSLEKSKTYSLKVKVAPTDTEYFYNIKFYIGNTLIGTLDSFRLPGVSIKPATTLPTGVSFDAPQLLSDGNVWLIADIHAGKSFLKPSATSPIFTVGGTALLSINTSGKLVLSDGSVSTTAIKGLNTYTVALKLLGDVGPNTYDYEVYVEGELVGRVHNAPISSTEIKITAPDGLNVKNIKFADTETLNGVHPASLTPIVSLANENEVPCVHREHTSLERQFYTVPACDATGCFVNLLTYSYECYLCGARVYHTLGENLYNSSTYVPTNYKNNSVKMNEIYTTADYVETSKNNWYYLYSNSALLGADCGKTVWINFTLEFEALSETNINTIIDKGSGGGSIFNINTSGYSSALRIYGIKEKDTDGNLVNDNTDPSKLILSSTSNATHKTYANSNKYVALRDKSGGEIVALIRQGSINTYTFCITPSSSSSTMKIWVDGVLRATKGKQYGDGSDGGFTLRFFEGADYGTRKVNNFAYVLDKAPEAVEHIHSDAYSNDSKKFINISDEIVEYAYDCYCNTRVKENITSVVANDIANLYKGYGEVEFTAPTNSAYWITTDINLRSTELSSGNLITLGNDAVYTLSDVGTVKNKTTLTVAVKVDGNAYDIFVDGYHKKSGTLSGDASKVTFGDESFDGLVRFKYNKIVTLGVTSSPIVPTYTDEPYGVICYHEGSKLTFTSQVHAVEGTTFDSSNNVKGMKYLKARYVCSDCGEAVYALHDQALNVNPDFSSDLAGTYKLALDANGNSEKTNAMRIIGVELDEVGFGNSYWISFDLKVDTTESGIKNLMGKGSGGSMFAFRIPDLQQAFLEKKDGDRFLYEQFLRVFAILRPDAEKNEAGKYTVEDYYNDRVGLFCTTSNEYTNQQESKFQVVLLSGNTYSVDICVSATEDGKLSYSTYIDGKHFRVNQILNSAVYDLNRSDDVASDYKPYKDASVDKSTNTVYAGEGYVNRYVPSLRVLDGNYGDLYISNFSLVKQSEGYDNFANDTAVFELEATNEAQGTIASVNNLTLLSADADGNLIANGETLYVDETATESYKLTSEASTIAIVYYNGNARYYVNEKLAYVGSALSTDFVTDGIDMSKAVLKVNDKAKVTDVYGSASNAEVEYVTYQTHETENGCLRIISGLDIPYFGKVGYRITTVDAATTTVSKTSNTVYTDIIAGGNTVSASRFGHKYFSLLSIEGLIGTNIASADGVCTIYVTPFTVLGDQTVYSTSSAKITVNASDVLTTYDQSIVATSAVPVESN